MSEIHGTLSTLQLRVLDCLLASRSVTQTGRELGLTQSAISHTLQGLRIHFVDELLVRIGQTMTLTPLAESLTEPVRSVLRQVEDVSALRERFEPATMTRRCIVAARDMALSLFGPRLIARFMEAAPLASLQIVPWETGLVAEQLAAGACDLAIGVDPPRTEGGLRIQKLFEDDYVAVCARANAPAVLDLDELVRRPGLIVTRTDRVTSPIDRELAARGLQRRVVMRSGYFMAALSIVGETDLLMGIPRRLASKHARTLDLAVLELPFKLAPFDVYCVSHERFASSPLHKWLRRLATQAVIETARPIPAE